MDKISTNEASIWEAVADGAGGAPAIVQGDRIERWRDFEQRAARLAAAFVQLGIGPGDRVAIDCFNCIEYLETVFAAFKLRAVPININYRYRGREIAHILDDSRADVVVCHRSLSDRVADGVERTGRPIQIVEVADGDAAALATAADYEALIATHDPAPRIERSADDEFILYTGGTTGMPRGVVWSHEALFAMQQGTFAQRQLPVPRGLDEYRQVAPKIAFDEQRPPASLIASPLMHGTALFGSLATFTGAGRIILCESRSLDPHEICGLIGKYRIRSLSIVGDVFARPILQALDEAADAGRPYDLSSLEQIMSSGVTWSAAVKRGLMRHGDFLLFDGVAASEGGGFAVSEVRRGEDTETARFKLGAKARVIDENGRDVVAGSGQIGMLAATGALPKGYLNDPERTARTFREIDGVRYVLPGDMARLEADGTVVLLGRNSEVVNTGGEKVFVEEVEQAILAHPAVRDVIVVGVPDERWTNRVAAAVALAPDTQLTDRDVIDFVGQSLADHKRPRQVVFVEHVERSPSGKANRAWARDVIHSAAVQSAS